MTFCKLYALILVMLAFLAALCVDVASAISIFSTAVIIGLLVTICEQTKK